jgi:hypothetical protein
MKVREAERLKRTRNNILPQGHAPSDLFPPARLKFLAPPKIAAAGDQAFNM